VLIFWGFRAIAEWTIFPWVTSDESGWIFTWLFIFAGYFEVGEEDGGS
jgi:hypothetical protein